jgi:hypothetical protein
MGVFSWAQGFISSMNMAIGRESGEYIDMSKVTVEDQWAHIAGYCRKNPSKLIMEAVLNLVTERFPRPTAPR